ncbi:hypothetical protein BV25DRAFT_1831024 [Artomyces pyxidatus]|uniref:Uncharacterized protein n=1 Tax=Artomyces pyxidatus TaxID=48021 RepID=A0ACB8SM95_9AGAM|nr:hypothetical protein BV25DRAFT_1831024 [Artomyces pyxidatus]
MPRNEYKYFQALISDGTIKQGDGMIAQSDGTITQDGHTVKHCTKCMKHTAQFHRETDISCDDCLPAENRTLRRCTGCRNSAYCVRPPASAVRADAHRIFPQSKTCQRAHWPEHGERCKKTMMHMNALDIFAKRSTYVDIWIMAHYACLQAAARNAMRQTRRRTTVTHHAVMVLVDVNIDVPDEGALPKASDATFYPSINEVRCMPVRAIGLKAQVMSLASSVMVPWSMKVTREDALAQAIRELAPCADAVPVVVVDETLVSHGFYQLGIHFLRPLMKAQPQHVLHVLATEAPAKVLTRCSSCSAVAENRLEERSQI